MPDSKAKILGLGRLNLAVFGSLLIVAALVLFGDLYLRQSSADQISYSHVVNLAGRQRMLSQKIAKTASFLHHSQTEEEFSQLKESLEADSVLWEQVHLGLKSGDPRLNLPVNKDPEIQQELVSLEPYLNEILSAISDIERISFSDRSGDGLVSLIRVISVSESKYLQIMDQIVTHYDENGFLNAQSAIRRDSTISIIILLALFLDGFFVFRPVLRNASLSFTKIQRAEEDLKKFKLAVENASDHIVITDENAVILYANKAVEKITGFPQSEVVGKKAGTKELWGGMMPPDFYGKMWETIKIKKKVFTGEVQNRRKNGEVYTALASISPILGDNGDVRFFVGIERDITKERAIDRAKTEFVSMASHQLRTPLTAINWYVEMLMSGDVGRVTKEQSSYLEEVYKGSQRMVRLVNDLLNVSRLELGKLLVAPVPTDLFALLKDIVKESHFVEAEHPAPVVLKAPAAGIEKIPVDPDLLRQVLRNLINNAVRYSARPKGRVVVGTERRVVEGADSVVFSVTDNGIGIPKKDQPRIFERMFRASNVDKIAASGTGLGLYISKLIVQTWGGKIWFESEENKGTTFFVTISAEGMKPSPEGTKRLL